MLVRNNRLRASDVARLREEASNFTYNPLVSILLPVFNPERKWFEQALDSVLDQIYPRWELCVCGEASNQEHAREVLRSYERLDERVNVTYLERNTSTSRSLNAALSLAKGEFAGLLAPDDWLAPDALFEVVRLLQEHPQADLIYSDMDWIDKEGSRSNPYFKPGWSPDLLLSTDYLSHLSVYRRSLVEEVGAFREEFDGCQDYDLVLRATERTDRIYHVPKVLYHRRLPTLSSVATDANDSDGLERQRLALSEALERRGIVGSVEDGILPKSFRVKARIEDEPKVSLIIPTRDNVSLLKNCVESIERLTAYRNYEILIVDNDSVDKATLQYLASTPHRVIRFREEFNYSKINNFAVSHAEGEYVLLLNDDTEVISGEWLEAMLRHAQRPEVGAVGAKLLYPDGRIQHAGVLIGVGNPWGPGVATHSHQFYSSSSPGYAGTVAMTTNYSAVTAACMMLRKSLFNEIGGFDEENLRVSFNDVDLCLRIRERGYSIVYTPYAELYHHESVSRGYKGDPAEFHYMRERWGEVLDKDPYCNPNFSKGSGDFNLRADLLRPRILRTDSEQPQEELESSFKSPQTTSREKYKRYLEAQHGVARDSKRTSIIPVRNNRSTAKSALLESLENHNGIDPQRAERQRADEPPKRAERQRAAEQKRAERQRADEPPERTERQRAAEQKRAEQQRAAEQKRAERQRAAEQKRAEQQRAAGQKRANESGARKSLHTEQLIWMFGSPRTGSTWLSRMMAELDNQERWHEPYIGLLFGSFIYERLGNNNKLLNNPSFIMGEKHRKVWLNSIRTFVIQGAIARYPQMKQDQYLVIKEPNGSIGAPLLMEAMPDSRMIFLIRDSRDVIASRLDAFRKDSWSSQGRDFSTPEKLNAFTKHLAEEYFKVVSQVQRAYEEHPGKKVTIRYEDLRQDTIGALKNMYRTLEIEFDEAQLKAAVSKHSWEHIPDSEKGSGKFYRKAQPGSWKNDLTPDQIQIIEDITGPTLSRFYLDRARSTL